MSFVKKFAHMPVSRVIGLTISIESLSSVVFDKNVFLVTFSFTNDQELINHQTTEGCSIEFIGYRMPPQEGDSCTVLFTKYQSKKLCQALLIFRLVS